MKLSESLSFDVYNMHAKAGKWVFRAPRCSLKRGVCTAGIPHLVRSSDLAPRKMEKEDAPMCSLPFNIFTHTFESKKFVESFTIAIRKITNVTMIVTSTMTPTTVVTVDNTLKVARTAESEKPEMFFYFYFYLC